ncbi:MAG: hypothetical protein PHF45_00910 [Candidatus Pacebacteria bacterium]|nr:hypothetical protein [Candidatus Paceibacterota bacterium]
MAKTLGRRSGSETFIVDKAGFYTYTLEASGIGGTKTKTETLEVLHLPIWQEINPVLPD